MKTSFGSKTIRLFTILFLLVFLMISVTTSFAQEPLPSMTVSQIPIDPFILADLTNNFIEGYQLTLGAEVTISIDNGIDPTKLSDLLLNTETGGDFPGGKVRWDLGEYNLAPGDIIKIKEGEVFTRPKSQAAGDVDRHGGHCRRHGPQHDPRYAAASPGNGLTRSGILTKQP